MVSRLIPIVFALRDVMLFVAAMYAIHLLALLVTL